VTDLRNTPAQNRAIATLDGILRAAREILHEHEHGADVLTTGLVADRADVSIGTVYRYFPDRFAILDEILPGRQQAHEVLKLRAEQQKHGYVTDAHDAKELVERSQVFAQRFAMDASFPDVEENARESLVTAAAFAVAAIEAFDRAAAAAK
jgi:AcrR family transcriptional regulator